MKTMNKYIESVFTKSDPLLEDVLHSIEENGMPSKSVSPSSGQLLTLLASMSKAKHVLEIGALGGYSGICLLRGTEPGGTLTSLELQESYAELAKNNVTKAGFGDRVSYRTGLALESLSALESEGKQFDFFFIDADKESYPAYLEACIRLAEQGARHCGG